MSDLHRLTVREAARLLARGEVSSADVEHDLRAAIHKSNPDLKAYTWLSDPTTEPPAASSPPAQASSLWGLGVAVKSNIATLNQPTDCSSRILAGYRPPYEASVVEQLRRAGAHVLGKTNMDEFGMGSSGEHSCHSAPRNPWRSEYTAGGSSGGSAAAVAADLAFYALGSDTGGSVRQPAHCCGIVGLKPTYGRCSRYGLVAFASSLDQIGPLCKDVADTALVYSALAGYDPRDATSLDVQIGDPVGAVDQPVQGMRIGVPWHLLGEGLAEDVAEDFRSTLADLQAEGVVITDVQLPTVSQAIACYYVICTAEASANLARFDGVQYGIRVDMESLASGEITEVAELVTRTRSEGLGTEVKRRILLGSYVLSAGYHEAYYHKALQVRTLVSEDFRRVFTSCDAVALPTAPTTAFPLGERLADPLQMYLSDVFTVPANLAGLPAITLPTGLDRSGLPTSLQLVAPPLQEESLFSLAGAVERCRGFQRRLAPEAS